MRFGPIKGGYGNRPIAADPFKELQQAGPGVGGPTNKLFTTPLSRRRRFDNQALGDTPPRDGPFAPGAAGIFKQLPPRARARKRKSSYDIRSQ